MSYPSDNRTGRRTRRSVGPSDPGPPSRPSQPADLVALMANYNPLVERRDAFPTLPMLRVVPVVSVPTIQPPPRIPPTRLQGYLNDLKKNQSNWDVDPHSPNYMHYFLETDNGLLEAQSTGHALLNMCACDKCGLLDHRNMFSCFKVGHLLCRSCIPTLRPTDNSLHYLGKCNMCPTNELAGFRSMTPAVWSLINKIPLLCPFSGAGCSERIYEADFGSHAASCPMGWRCFICSTVLRADQIEGHFLNRGGSNLGHPALTYLVPRYLSNIDDGACQGSTKLRFDIRIPYNSEFAVSRFEMEGFGAFVLYQVQLDEYEMIWIVVQNGTNPEDANKVTVEMELTATSTTLSATGERSVHTFKWMNRIYPWRTRLIHSIEEVMRNDASLTETAKFNFKTLAEDQGERNFRCNLTVQLREIVSGDSPPRFGLVDPQPVTDTSLPIKEMRELNLSKLSSSYISCFYFILNWNPHS